MLPGTISECVSHHRHRWRAQSLPGRDKRFKPQYWLAAKCWELEIGKAAERLNQAGSRQGLPSTLKRLFG